VSKNKNIKGKLQRKELKKAIKRFSNEANFYKLGLVRKYIQHMNEEQNRLNESIPKVTCPRCGGNEIEIDHDESEYSSDSWLCCESCYETFDDTFGFIDAVGEADAYCWSDTIAIELHFEEPDVKNEEWQKFCKSEILKRLEGETS
jgi:hypothetical protein